MVKNGTFAMVVVIALSLVTVSMATQGNDKGNVTWGKINPNGTETINYYNESHIPGYVHRVYPNGTVIKEPFNESNMPNLNSISNVTTHYVDNWNATPSPSATPTSDATSIPSATAQRESSQIPGFHVGLAVGMLLVSYLMHKKRSK